MPHRGRFAGPTCLRCCRESDWRRDSMRSRFRPRPRCPACIELILAVVAASNHFPAQRVSATRPETASRFREVARVLFESNREEAFRHYVSDRLVGKRPAIVLGKPRDAVAKIVLPLRHRTAGKNTRHEKRRRIERVVKGNSELLPGS